MDIRCGKKLMSRTRKGNKGAGYDYWGKRPLSGRGYGKDIKDATKKIERARSKEATRRGDDLPFKEPF